MNRKEFLKFVSLAPIIMSTSCLAKVPKSSLTYLDPETLEKKNSAQDLFVKLVKSSQPVVGNGLVTYMKPQKNNRSFTLSTIASATLLLFFIKSNNIAEAKKVANGIVQVIRLSAKVGNKYTKGGVPTEISAHGNTWKLGEYYYASDNMIVIYALNLLYELTNDSSYAECALVVGRWLIPSLFDGKAQRMWRVNYGMPMHYIKKDGAIDNSIHTAGDFLWLQSLIGLQKLDPSLGSKHLLIDALNFMKSAQMESGAWYTSFIPDRFKRTGQWHGFKGDDLTIGDDNLRSAIAASIFGMDTQVKRFQSWLSPKDEVFLWGYLATDVCKPKFLPQDTPYFDVVCSGLLRSWYLKTEKYHLINSCQQVLNSLQDKDGGWFWAATQDELKPLNSEKAIITGCWALTDIV